MCGSTQANLSTRLSTSTKGIKKRHDHLYRCRKSISFSSTSIHHKNYSQSVYKENIAQPNENYLGPTHCKPNSPCDKLIDFPLKIWNMAKIPARTPCINIQHGTGRPIHNHHTRNTKKGSRWDRKRNDCLGKYMM